MSVSSNESLLRCSAMRPGMKRLVMACSSVVGVDGVVAAGGGGSAVPVSAAGGGTDNVDTALPQPVLVTVPNVELLEVGENWMTSTGIFDFTHEDLVSCIESQEDPAVRTPVLKLGHTDPRFDGQPSFGRIENLRLDNNGQTLVGDIVAVPFWLASCMSTAYPRRSIEGSFNETTRSGNTWALVLTGLALLGDSYPAIDTLEDITALWGATAPPLYPVEDVDEIAASYGLTTGFTGHFRARKVEEMPNWLKRNGSTDREEVRAGAAVRAQVSLDDIRRTYYDTLNSAQMWWWIREIRVNPLQLVVDDDEGGLYTVDINVDGSDNITFGDPSAVKVAYVAAAGLPRQAGQLVAASFGSKEESGGKPKPDAAASGTVPSATPEEEEETDMQLSETALRKLGLGPDATQEQIEAALLALSDSTETPEGGGETTPAETTPANEPQSQPTTPATEPAAQPTQAPETETTPESSTSTPTIPEGMALVDEGTLAELREGAVAARSLVQERDENARNSFLDNAIRAGKFPPSRREHYEKAWAADSAGTRQMIDALSEGLVPVQERGTPGGETDPTVQASAYPESWKRTVSASRRGVGSKVKVVGD